MSIEEVKNFLEIYEKVKGTPLEILIPIIAFFAIVYCLYKWFITPVYKVIKLLIGYIQKKHFMKKNFHENLSFMNSEDAYYAINHFVPTRYSSRDPAYNDEPIPEYMGEEAKREPLLLNHFLKYEFDQKYGGKYYLCLGDCGIGKTTFLINLYYETLRKKKKYKCIFISLQDSKCIERIEKIDTPEKTILLLDALDENESAVINFNSFMIKLEDATKLFYRVVITSRTNFFVTEEKERLSTQKSSISTTEKIFSARKYYIAPFTDEDIQHYLKQRYRFKKYKQAWKIMDTNKNLSVRPMLLRYIDDLLIDNKNFHFDYQLYEYLFTRWIEREKGSLSEELGKCLYDECIVLAKSIYYQWQKTGRVGIYPNEVSGSNAIPGLAKIKFRGHAMLNRTSDGMYKFAHKSFWEFLLAKIALQDVFFSDDLFIHSFEQAESFLKEMIASGEFQTPEAILGTACYYLKYQKPEDAEVTIQNILQTEIPEDLALFARIQLIKSYQRQMKEASAEHCLLQIYEQLKSIELTKNIIPLFSKFGNVLSTYSRDRKIKLGQEFLGETISFCKQNGIVGYDLLRCYENYCYCALNYALKSNALEEMEQLVSLQKGDRYAECLYTLASVHGKLYTDTEAMICDKRLINQYGQLRDNYETILDYCRFACSLIATYFDNYDGDFDSVQDEATEFLGKAYDICSDIYDDRHKTIHNPYMARITMYIITYFSFFEDYKEFKNERIKESTQALLDYCHNYHLKDEMQTIYCGFLRNTAKYSDEDFEIKEKYQFERLTFARSIQCRCEEISALWDIYFLYSENRREIGQTYLKTAYETACSDLNYTETNSFCILQQVMLDFYDEMETKEQIFQDLCQITPKIYGNDMRRERIYRSLRNYALKKNDNKVLEFAKEVLQCDFNCNELQQFYKVCIKYSDEAHFIAELEAILYGYLEVLQNHQDAIEEFLSSNLSYKDENNNLIEITYSSDFCRQVRESVKTIKQQKDHERFSKRLVNSFLVRV